MFGTYRFVLAMMVVGSHLGGLMALGSYAVFAFYMLSGYLMTLIMQHSYGYSSQGRLKYALNRCLRIFPIYWLACLLSLCLIVYLGEAVTKEYHQQLYVPQDVVSWLSNIFLVFSYASEPRLTPPSWALTVELFFYICIGLGLSKTKSLTLLWFVLSVTYTLYVNIAEMGWAYKYFYISAASLPFSTGALLFHFRESLLQYIPILASKLFPVFVLMGIFINYIIAHETGMLKGYAFYINFMLNILMMGTLLYCKTGLMLPKRLDKWLGDLSYPIYLIHWQVGLLLASVGLTFQVGTLSFFFACVPMVLLFAWLISRYIEVPIEHLRASIKVKD